MSITIQPADKENISAILALLPRLANFDVPTNRNPDHLWQGDADLFRDWAAGNRADVEVRVAIVNEELVGASMVSFRKELLSGEPSAHLEVLVVDKKAEGRGIAAALITDIEKFAVSKGAQWMSLHVFANNTRARAVYERHEFEGELLRYIKKLN